MIFKKKFTLASIDQCNCQRKFGPPGALVYNLELENGIEEWGLVWAEQNSRCEGNNVNLLVVMSHFNQP